MDARAKLRRAARRYEEARAARDEAIRQAAAEHMTRRSIAEVVGLSFQRIQQIIREEPRPKGS